MHPLVDQLARLALAESDRLFALEPYADRVTQNEPIFDALTTLAASLLDAPFCLITLIEGHRQFFKSAYGRTARDLSQAEAFCTGVTASDKLQVILDAAVDPQFNESSSLLRDSGICFYAGVPLVSNHGARLGTFCVLDVKARVAFPQKQQEALIQFGFLASSSIEDRLLAIQVNRAEKAVEEASLRVRQILEATTDCVFLVDKEGCFTFLNQEASNHFAGGKDLLGQPIWSILPAPLRGSSEVQYRHALTAHTSLAFEGARSGSDEVYEVNVHPSGDGLAVFVRDVSEQRATELALHKVEERYRIATLSVTEGIWDWDPVSGVAYFSSRWQQIVGLPALPFTGDIRHWFERLHPSDTEAFGADFSQVPTGVTSEFSHEYRVRHEDGTWRWIVSHGTVVCDENQKRVRMAGSICDHTERKSTDPLSGLHNRMSLLENVDHALEHPVVNGGTFALLAINLDAFKRVNDRFTQAGGDNVLIEIGRRLEGSLISDAVSIAARTSTDEFVVLLYGIASVDDGLTYALCIQKIIAEPIEVDEQQLRISACVGIAMGDEGYVNSSKMLADAEMALHQAKREGTERCVVFGTNLRERTVRRIQLELDLRGAVEAGQLVLHYQPKVLIKTGEIVGFEALVRWNHPQRGMISPADFIPFAEESGLILEIGRWTLREALRQLMAWRASDLFTQDVTISVNLSARQFEDPSLIAKIIEALAEHKAPASCLTLEITESSLIHDIVHARETMSELRKIGIAMDLDDFGTGYSSLSYLHGLPFDSVKIDQSFVKQLTNSEDSRVIVRSIIQLAESLDLKVVAEGIENADQAQRISLLHCYYGQGFFYSRPLPATAMAVFIRGRLK